MSNVIKELGTKSLTRPKKDDPGKALRPPLPNTPSSPQQRPQMPLPAHVVKHPNIPLPPTPNDKPVHVEQEQKPTSVALKPLKTPVKQALKPPVKETKSVDIKPKAAPPKPLRSKSTDDMGRNTSPVPRPRNKPPPPPGGSFSPQASIEEDLDSSDNTGKRGLSHTWSGKPKPLPRVRPKQVMSDEDRQSSQDSLDGSLQESAFRAGLKSPTEPRRGSYPVPRPNALSKQSSPTKPKPPAKPSLPKRPNVPGALNKKLSPQAEKVVKLIEEGQTKANEIIHLTGAREDNNLTELVDDFLKLSLRVKESLSTLTDSLSPQARFKFRQTVTEYESKYNDLDSVIQTVGRNFTAIDMERINKVTCGVNEGLDGVYSTIKAMGT